jgi:hypothetical protein
MPDNPQLTFAQKIQKESRYPFDKKRETKTVKPIGRFTGRGSIDLTDPTAPKLIR